MGLAAYFGGGSRAEARRDVDCQFQLKMRCSKQTLAGEFQDLVDGESNEAEGKMGEHLGGSTNANVPCAEFILEAAVDAFHCGALLETVLLRPCQLRRLLR